MILLEGPRVLVAIMVCVLTPLAFRAVAMPRLTQLMDLAGIWAAACVLVMESGEVGGIFFVGVYALLTMLAALVGVQRLLARPWPPSQLAQHVALIVLAGASVWLVAYQAGYALLGYPPFWVLLTAAHFHVAGCFLAIVVGWAAHGRGKLAQLAALGCIVGVPLTAIGIAWSHTLEVIAGVVMAASGFGAGG
ncbi:MAG TPA: YndJ family transporter, partial [Kofleriaceae bacterium]